MVCLLKRVAMCFLDHEFDNDVASEFDCVTKSHHHQYVSVHTSYSMDSCDHLIEPPPSNTDTKLLPPNFIY